jgi:hypothetical protein
MSDIVGGGISRGRGNGQVTLAFVGRMNNAEWAAFVQCVVECANRAGVSVSQVTAATSVTLAEANVVRMSRNGGKKKPTRTTKSKRKTPRNR